MYSNVSSCPLLHPPPHTKKQCLAMRATEAGALINLSLSSAALDACSSFSCVCTSRASVDSKSSSSVLTRFVRFATSVSACMHTHVTTSQRCTIMATTSIVLSRDVYSLPYRPIGYNPMSRIRNTYRRMQVHIDTATWKYHSQQTKFIHVIHIYTHRPGLCGDSIAMSLILTKSTARWNYSYIEVYSLTIYSQFRLCL